MLAADTHKRGDSFVRTVNVPSQFADGYFVGWTMACQLRTQSGSGLVATLDCAWIDPVTTRAITISKIDTTGWPVGPLLYDIQFTRTSDGFVVSTSTLAVTIQKDQTYA